MATTRAILIIGSGFVGTHLALKFREGYKVFATYHSKLVNIRGVTMLPMNLVNENWVKRIVYTIHPDVVIYAAGRDDVLWAEANQKDAEAIHSNGPATAVGIAEILHPKFIFISNSYTFDGNRGNYRESDTVLPATVYGRAKVGGENFIRGRSLNYIITRSSPLFGRGTFQHPSFIDSLRMALDRGQKIELRHSELHSFAPVAGFVQFIASLIEGGPRNKTLHYGGLTKVTHYEFGRMFAERFKYDPNLVLPIRDITSKNPDQGPTLDYSLNSSQMAEQLKIKPLLLEEGLDLFENDLIASS